MATRGVTEIFAAMRRASASGVLVNHAVAARIGLNPIDLECLDYIVERGSATAGEIGARTRLTSGAVTGLIDRLVKAGFVRREFSGNDRRKVFVVPETEKLNFLEGIYAPVAQAMSEVVAGYSDADLSLVARFLNQASEATENVIGKLSDGASR